MRGILSTVLFFLASTMLSGQSAPNTYGYLTDTLCGSRGANRLHAEHARRSVASGKAKYAIYDEQSKQLYIIEDAALAERWLGQRVRVTGTVGATPLRRAGQSYAPDAVATVRDAQGRQRPVSGNPSAADAASGRAPLDTTTPRVQQHRNALDTTTPIAGVLTIATIEPADATAAPPDRRKQTARPARAESSPQPQP